MGTTRCCLKLQAVRTTARHGVVADSYNKRQDTRPNPNPSSRNGTRREAPASLRKLLQSGQVSQLRLAEPEKEESLQLASCNSGTGPVLPAQRVLWPQALGKGFRAASWAHAAEPLASGATHAGGGAEVSGRS